MQVQTPSAKPGRLEITRTWQEPVYEKQRLGSIPADYYEPAYSSHYCGSELSTTENHHFSGGNKEAGPTPVVRDVPVYENGKPKMISVTKTLAEDAYDSKKAALVSSGVGTALGAAAAAGLSAILGSGTPALAISGLLGAAAGGGAGYLIGKKATEGDAVVEKQATGEITHPTLTGYQHCIDPDVHYDYQTHHDHHGDHDDHHTEVIKHLRGYQHDFHPLISNKVVGTYTYPTLEHTAKASPGTGGVLAGLAGAGAGAAIAGILAAVI